MKSSAIRIPLFKESEVEASVYQLTLSLSSKDVLRWNRAAAELKRKYETKQIPIFASDLHFFDSNPAFITLRSMNLFLQSESLPDGRRARYHPFEFIFFSLLEYFDSFGSLVLLFLLGMVYGALHLSLWNYKFATNVEKVSWRLSCVTITAYPAFFNFTFLMYVPMRLTPRVRIGYRERRYISHLREENAKSKSILKKYSFSICWEYMRTGLDCGATMLLFLFMILVAIVGLVFVFARIFLVVESFISLRHVPMGVYLNVGWVKYIPHL